LYSEFITSARLSGVGGATNQSVSLDNNTASEVFFLSQRSTGTATLGLVVVDDGVTTAYVPNSNTFTLGQLTKHAGTYYYGNTTYCARGGIVSANGGFNLSAPSRLQFSAFGGSGAGSVTHMKNIKMYPFKLSDAKLQEITS
jgi:hypothetical protein